MSNLLQQTALLNQGQMKSIRSILECGENLILIGFTKAVFVIKSH
jgi:hypothetical protein